MRGARQDALLVFQIGFCHFNGRGCRGVKRRPGFQQGHNFGSAIARALHNFVNAFLRGPFHLTRSAAEYPPRLNSVRTAPLCRRGRPTQRPIHRTETLNSRQKITEARRVQHDHAHHFVFRQAGNFCNAQTMASSGLVIQMTKALGAYFLMPSPTCRMTFN